MSYYPTNFYSNYPYQQSYMQQPNQIQYSQPQITNPQPVQQGLSGKIVDSIDVAKVADIPFGGYGIFPKADLSEIYIKSWNGNGTTSMLTFKPIIDVTPTQENGQENNNTTTALLKKMECLEHKINELMSNKKEDTSNRKELTASAY